MNKQLLYFNFEDRIFEFHLPAINNRRYSLDLLSVSIAYPCEIQFEVWDEIWYLKQNSDISILIDGLEYDTVCLNTGMLINICLKKQKEMFSIMVLEESTEITEFRKYSLVNRDEITIGAAENSDILISQEYVSRNHAKLYRKADGFYIKDTSKNGTFLNGQRLLGTMKLNCFDEIYILGVKIVYLGELLAINHSETVQGNLMNIEVNASNFTSVDDLDLSEGESDKCFSRSPRNMHDMMEIGIVKE